MAEVLNICVWTRSVSKFLVRDIVHVLTFFSRCSKPNTAIGLPFSCSKILVARGLATALWLRDLFRFLPRLRSGRSCNRSIMTTDLVILGELMGSRIEEEVNLLLLVIQYMINPCAHMCHTLYKGISQCAYKMIHLSSISSPTLTSDW